MSLEGGPRNGREQQDQHVRDWHRAKLDEAVAADNANMPEGLKFDSSLKELGELEETFGKRMRELSRAKNEGSATPEQQREWQERSKIWGEVRDMFEEASRVSGIMVHPRIPGTRERDENETVPFTRRNTLLVGELRSIKDQPDTLSKIAEIYGEIRKKLESMPV